MHPLMMAALISGGVNALQGKRGSDLLKSTVRDTAIAAALGINSLTRFRSIGNRRFCRHNSTQ